MDIGLTLKQFRKDKKLTQKELAIKLNTSQQHISQLERNQRHLHAKELFKVLEVLNIPNEFIVAESISSRTYFLTDEEIVLHLNQLCQKDKDLFCNLLLRLSSKN